MPNGRPRAYCPARGRTSYEEPNACCRSPFSLGLRRSRRRLQEARPARAGRSPAPVFDVKAFGATGLKDDLAQEAIQKAVDACAAAGGGTVLVPPGEYTTGTIHLRSHVRLYVEGGATVFSVHDKSRFDRDALLYGEDLAGVTIEGRGTFDGGGAYDRRLKGDHEDDFIRPNQVEMEQLGLPLLRSFPKPDRYGKMVLLVRCTDVRIAGVSFVDSPPGPSIPSSASGWSSTGSSSGRACGTASGDGIDPDGCKDVRIANCTVETGDDALVFYSMDWFGPARPCENITVTNCRLSSASSASSSATATSPGSAT